ncbi:MAG: hypothetical protein JWO67_3829 [Streptosporangiaceae bacterium]|nr:hypothetical protein [Streptosporangiaceae bacterium]
MSLTSPASPEFADFCLYCPQGPCVCAERGQLAVRVVRTDDSTPGGLQQFVLRPRFDSFEAASNFAASLCESFRHIRSAVVINVQD